MLALGLPVGVTLAQRHINESGWVNVVSPALRGNARTLRTIAFVEKKESPVIKSILIPASGNEADTATFAAALDIARMFGAHIEALHVRLDPVELAVAATTDGGGGGMLMQGLIDDLERDADARETQAKRLFTEFCARESLPMVEAPAEAGGKPSAQWHVEIGQEPRWMSNYGITADLIVYSRGIPGDDAVARSTLEALLLESGRPLLIPSAATPSVAMADRVAIAGSRRSRRRARSRRRCPSWLAPRRLS